MKASPAGAAISYTKSDLDDIGKVRAITPTVHDIAAACGATVRTEVNQFGREEVVANVPAAVAFEAMRPSWRADTHRLGGMEGRRSKTTLRGKNGQEKRVDSFAAESVAKSIGGYEPWAYGAATYRYRGGRYYRKDKSGQWVESEPPPSRMHEILEARQGPKVVVH
jgi:hypothetical protein